MDDRKGYFVPYLSQIRLFVVPGGIDMKRFHYFLSGMAAAILLGCLWGCSPTEPPGTTPSTLPTTLPPETTEPVVTESSILSWKIPDYPRMRYEEYFSTVHIYGYTPIDEDPQTYYYSSAWNNGTDSCELWFQRGKLLAGSSLDGKYVQVGSETYDDDDLIVACNEEWIFLVLDGKELIRMDYHGENKETLFVDESGKIAQHEAATAAYIRDNCVLFFMAGCEDGYGIYRLYLPENKLDLLVTSKESIWLLDPYSNHELSWFINNPDFSALCKQILDDPPEKYQHMLIDGKPYGNAFFLEIARDYETPWEIDYYYNTLTGERLEKGLYGDRSWGLMAKAWWLDE
jgi:hypothetical protein